MIEVEAVKSKGEIAAIEALLKKHHGQIYSDIWKIGLNLSLRISDLRAIRYQDLDMDRKEISLIEGKTGKKRCIRLNDTVIRIINQRRKLHPSDVYLFQVHSNRATGNPISRNSVSRAFKDAGDRIGLRISTHSMRKSRGFVMHADGVPIEQISRVLNHSHPAVTMRYLGITNKEVMDSYDQYEL
jgi:integrase